MNKPTRKVMSMVPNQQYLHGYNDCVEEADRHNRKMVQLLIRVLAEHVTIKDLAPDLKSELVELVGDEYRAIVDKIVVEAPTGEDCATEYDVDMDRQRLQDEDRAGMMDSDVDNEGETA